MYQTITGIKSWAEADRPREKLLEKGKSTLTDAELMAILIGSGSKKETAVELSRRILSSVDNNLFDLGKLSVPELSKFKGIGAAKAITIISALELGRRRKESETNIKVKIGSSADAAAVFQNTLEDAPHEEFWILLLNRGNYVVKKICISLGGLVGTVVDSRIIFKHAIENLSTSLILCHNHPSGNSKPSDADISITKKIKESGLLLEIPVLDHIIIGGKGYYSFADEGLL